MVRTITRATWLAAMLSIVSQSPSRAMPVAPAADLVLTHIAVVDVRTGATHVDETVEIARGKIVAMRSPSEPARSVGRVVDERGKFLIPGLWDGETHLSWTTASALPTLLANGITGVRDMGGDLEQLDDWRRKIASGRLAGPTIFRVGPMLNGKRFNRYQYALTSPASTRAEVERLHAAGVDGVEIERRVSRNDYFALVDAARKRTLPVYGHVPIDVEPLEAVDAGQTTIDNVETIYDGRFRSAGAGSLASRIRAFLEPGGGAGALFERMHERHLAVTPVLDPLASVLATRNGVDASRSLLRYVAASQRRAAGKPISSADVAELRDEFPLLEQTVRRMNECGVTLLAGTDIAGTRIPGFTLHRELADLAASGLRPVQVLRAATLNQAEVMHVETRYGSVEPGKVADLVVLDGDPTKDVRAVDRIHAFVRNGTYLDRNALDALLRRGASSASRS